MKQATEMKRSWLVQRLTPKRGGRMGEMINAFSFGGGLRNGGLSNEAMGLLPFGFDYMGAAEFEFGAVPKALQRMAGDHKKMVTSTACDGQVFVVAHRDHIDEAVQRIEEWASAPYVGGLKEPTYLHGMLNPVNDWDSDRIGGLELDNGFLYTIDREVFDAFCILLGVEQ